MTATNNGAEKYWVGSALIRTTQMRCLVARVSEESISIQVKVRYVLVIKVTSSMTGELKSEVLKGSSVLLECRQARKHQPAGPKSGDMRQNVHQLRGVADRGERYKRVMEIPVHVIYGTCVKGW